MSFPFLQAYKTRAKNQESVIWIYNCHFLSFNKSLRMENPHQQEFSVKVFFF